MIKFCLIFHSARSDNLGVGALTLSQIEIIRALCAAQRLDYHITILDWKDPRPPYVSGSDVTVIPVSGRDLINPNRVFKWLRQADLVIDIGAGDSFSDIYGMRRLNRMLFMKYLVRLARRPMILAPQTFGPFKRKRAAALARATISSAALVATRDTLSTEALQKMGFQGRIVPGSDVALRLPYDPSYELPATDRPRVGLNVSGLLMAGGYTGQNQFQLGFDYPGMIRRLIARFLTHPDRPELHLIPHVISPSQPSEDDNAAAQMLAEEFPEVIVAPDFKDPVAAKSYIAGMDFFTGARMHACIAAFSTKVPVVPMAYSRKFEGLFGTMGYHRTIDCKNTEIDQVLDRVMSGYDNRASLAAEVNVAALKGITLLDNYVDAFGEVVRQISTQTSKTPDRVFRSGVGVNVAGKRELHITKVQ